jgi:glycosyltransferase involved in cell wall biosynthesis
VRIRYWTTACLDARIEAVSKEVHDLREHFRPSGVVAVSHHFRAPLSWTRAGICVRPELQPLLRQLMPALELRGDLNHVYAEVVPEGFLGALGRRPTVMTIASEKGEPLPEFLADCAAIVVQTRGMARRLAAAGCDPRRVRLIYPGVDLARFRPREGAPGSPGAVRVLFATFPRHAQELAERGVNLLLEAATALPAVRFELVSRPWRGGATALDVVKARLARRPTPNVELVEGLQADMSACYARSTFTAIPYTRPDGGKECPRSLVESLACGVPVLISRAAPFAEYVAERGCGVVFDGGAAGLRGAIDAGLDDYAALSARAAACAREDFDLGATLRAYRGLYDEVLAA